MNWLNNQKIGARLGAGFGVVLVLMIAIIAFALNSFRAIERDTETLLKDDLVKLEAANVISTYMRASKPAALHVVKHAPVATAPKKVRAGGADNAWTEF